MTPRIIDWWRRRRWTAPRYVRLAYFDKRSDVPAPLPRRSIVIVGDPGRPKWAIFTCPCGNDHEIAVNLASARRPAWKVTTGDGSVTLHPSVDSVTPSRRCHFWVRGGRIAWANNRERE